MYFIRAGPKHSVTSWLPDIHHKKGDVVSRSVPCPCHVSKLPTAEATQQDRDLENAKLAFPQTQSRSECCRSSSQQGLPWSLLVLFPHLLPSLCLSASSPAFLALQNYLKFRKQPKPSSLTADQAHGTEGSPAAKLESPHQR